MAATANGVTIKQLRDTRNNTYFAITEFSSSLKLCFVWWQKLNLTWFRVYSSGSTHILQKLNNVCRTI